MEESRRRRKMKVGLKGQKKNERLWTLRNKLSFGVLVRGRVSLVLGIEKVNTCYSYSSERK